MKISVFSVPSVPIAVFDSARLVFVGRLGIVRAFPERSGAFRDCGGQNWRNVRPEVLSPGQPGRCFERLGPCNRRVQSFFILVSISYLLPHTMPSSGSSPRGLGLPSPTY